MDINLEPAIAALERQLDEQQRGVLDTKKSINLLLKMAGENPRYTDEDAPSGGWVRPDQFYGKSLTAAAAEYLGMRKQACPPAEIVRALETGGFDFDMLPWKKDERVRPFAISLAKNTGSETGKFHKLKNGSFGLKAWYEEEFLKKAGANAAEAKAQSKKKKKKKAAKKAAETAEPKKETAQPPKKSGSAEQQKTAPPVPAAKPKSSAKKGSPVADQQAAPKEKATK
jgi:hypothetical protein